MSGGWFLDREDAEAFLATLERNPDYTYTIALNGCGPGWGIAVHDADGRLITEAYTGDEVAAR